MYAGFWRRVFAYILDWIICGIVWACVLFPFNGKVLSPLTFALLLLVCLTLWFFYFVYAEASPWQATLGKMILGIKVVDTHGYRISIARSAGRNICLSLSIITFYIGFLMCLWTRKEQCLHDIISDCLVVTKDVQPSPEFSPTKAPLIMWFFLVIIPIMWLAFMSIPLRIVYLMNKQNVLTGGSVTAQHGNDLTPSFPVAVQRFDKPATPKPSSFKEAIERGDAPSIIHYLQNGENPNQKTEEATPYLFLAKDGKTLSLLLQAGADVNAKNAKGETALMKAVEYGNFEKVDTLLNNGASVNARTKEGITPLMYICMIPVDEDSYQEMEPWLRETARVAVRLIQAGADVNMVERDLHTSLSYCGVWGNDEVAKVLLKAGASSEIRDLNGNTPLMMAAQYNHPRVLSSLIRKGVLINASNNDGETALIKAAQEGNAEAVRLLLAAGALPDLQDKRGYNALFWAHLRGDVNMYDSLIKSGAKPLRM